MSKQREEKAHESKATKEREKSNAESRGCCASLDTLFHSKHTPQQRQEGRPLSEMGTSNKIIFAFAALALIIMIFNQVQLFSISAEKTGVNVPTGISLVAAAVTPTGIPAVYGKELGIAYDDVSPNDPQKADKTIGVLRSYDEGITLSGQNLERYIAITSQISCEYCCGAKSIIFTKEDEQRIEEQIQAAIASGKITADQEDQYRRKAGEAACGCAHSFAMRGLAKYLITKQGSEFTDDQILEELAKWKTLFFPTQMNSKAQVMKEKGIAFSYSNLGSNKYRGIEQSAAGSGSGGSMVGGC